MNRNQGTIEENIFAIHLRLKKIFTISGSTDIYSRRSWEERQRNPQRQNIPSSKSHSAIPIYKISPFVMSFMPDPCPIT